MKWGVWGIIIAAIVTAILITRRFLAPPRKSIEDIDPNDLEALARMIASENPNDSTTVRTAIAWSAVNEANRRGKSVFDLLAPDGNFGPQSGRYASTRNAARSQDYEITTDVLTGAVNDPTGGAVQFDSPRGQRAALARNVSGYSKTPEQVAAQRISEGKVEVNLPGVDPEHMRWWRYA